MDRSDDDFGLEDVVGGPGLGYAADNSETSTSSTPSAPRAIFTDDDLRDRTTARGMSRRQEALRCERSQTPRPRHRPNHQMPDSLRPRPATTRQPNPSRRPTPVQQPSYSPIYTSHPPHPCSRSHWSHSPEQAQISAPHPEPLPYPSQGHTRPESLCP